MTTPNTISALVAGQLAALDVDQAQGLLSMPLPQASAGQEVAMDRSERYAISRGVAFVPVTGLLTPNMHILERILGWTTYQGLEETMDQLAADQDVAAVALIMDTPGGFVIGCDAAAKAVAATAAVKPIHAIAHPLAASAGYYIASQATELVVTAGSQVGSVGVAVMTPSFVQPSQLFGWQMFEMASSHANAKRPDPATDEGRAELQRRLDEAETAFHAAVSRGRGIPAAELPERLSMNGDPAWGGGMYEPEDAIARGLADRLETRAAFDARMLETYGPPPSSGTPRRRRGARARAQAAQVRAGL